MEEITHVFDTREKKKEHNLHHSPFSYAIHPAIINRRLDSASKQSIISKKRGCSSMTNSKPFLVEPSFHVVSTTSKDNAAITKNASQTNK
jgi:hypothetical protein